MLRLHFTTDDLLRTRFVTAPVPLMEVGLGLAMLQRNDPRMQRWRASAARRLPAGTRQLLELIPASGAGPLFLDPITTTLDEGLELVATTPGSFVQEELGRVTHTSKRFTTGMRHLLEHDRDTWRDLTRNLRQTHAALASEECGPRIANCHAADVAWRTHTMATAGLREMLAGLYPGSRWAGAVLEIDVPATTDLLLGGRGLTLLPSPIWAGRPLVGDHPDGSTLLVYPVPTPWPLLTEDNDGSPVAALLGRTRAATLTLLTRPRTTRELARDLGMSEASASEHATTMRAAGLITSRRDGKAVLHHCSPLGLQLLHASQP
ncbi:ArsR/SmtB family transcription factor [Streptomyces sp. NBC_01431]|uniref:ArsR/SmtB family transcription factor n=1 Tax=Streptomyces sp. NBC_01431 TaxID=2903863 RepID=UPI002E37FF03|nr:winged helix-turn-helix domain-containing protein [Streptomyces sp. NBC_01431]